jgi:hypothetical protein
MKKHKIKIGVAWYREDQWPLLKSTASDPEAIEDTYHEWLEHIGKAMKKLKREDYEPVKIDFDVNKFNDWCRINKKDPNGESRAEYTTHFLRIMDKYSSN